MSEFEEDSIVSAFKLLITELDYERKGEVEAKNYSNISRNLISKLIIER